MMNPQINWLFILSQNATAFTLDFERVSGIKALWVNNYEDVMSTLKDSDKELFGILKKWLVRIQEKHKAEERCKRLKDFTIRASPEEKEELTEMKNSVNELKEYYEKHRSDFKPNKVNISNNRLILKETSKEKPLMAAEIMKLTLDEASKKLNLQDYLAYVKLKYKYCKIIDPEYEESEDTVDLVTPPSETDRSSTPKRDSGEN